MSCQNYFVLILAIFRAQAFLQLITFEDTFVNLQLRAISITWFQLLPSIETLNTYQCCFLSFVLEHRFSCKLLCIKFEGTQLRSY